MKLWIFYMVGYLVLVPIVESDILTKLFHKNESSCMDDFVKLQTINSSIFEGKTIKLLKNLQNKSTLIPQLGQPSHQLTSMAIHMTSVTSLAATTSTTLNTV